MHKPHTNIMTLVGFQRVDILVVMVNSLKRLSFILVKTSHLKIVKLYIPCIRLTHLRNLRESLWIVICNQRHGHDLIRSTTVIELWREQLTRIHRLHEIASVYHSVSPSIVLCNVLIDKVRCEILVKATLIGYWYVSVSMHLMHFLVYVVEQN